LEQLTDRDGFELVTRALRVEHGRDTLQLGLLRLGRRVVRIRARNGIVHVRERLARRTTARIREFANCEIQFVLGSRADVVFRLAIDTVNLVNHLDGFVRRDRRIRENRHALAELANLFLKLFPGLDGPFVIRVELARVTNRKACHLSRHHRRVFADDTVRVNRATSLTATTLMIVEREEVVPRLAVDVAFFRQLSRIQAESDDFVRIFLEKEAVVRRNPAFRDHRLQRSNHLRGIGRDVPIADRARADDRFIRGTHQMVLTGDLHDGPFTVRPRRLFLADFVVHLVLFEKFADLDHVLSFCELCPRLLLRPYCSRSVEQCQRFVGFLFRAN